MGLSASQTWVWFPARKDLRSLAVVGVLYVITSLLNFRYGLRADGIPVVWLPFGLAVGSMLVYGLQVWPAVALAAPLAALLNAQPAPTLVLGSLAAVAEPLAAASLLRVAGYVEWGRYSLRAYFAALLVGAGLIPAGFAVLNSLIEGPTPNRWFYWWLADALGMLLIAPLAVALPWLRWPRAASRRVHLVAYILIFVCVHAALVVDATRSGFMTERAGLLLFPLLILAAVRHGLGGTALALFASAVVARIADIAGWGVFAQVSESGDLTRFSLFYGTLGLTCLALAVSTEEEAAIRHALHTSRRKLAESEANFRSLAESSSVMIWVGDTARRCTWFNDAWSRFTGRTPEQDLGDGWLDAIHPDDRARVVAAYEQAFGSRIAFAIDYRLRDAQGGYRWITHRGAPRYDDVRQFLGYTSHCWDVTDRHSAEQALLERESILRTIYDASSVAIFLVDRHGRISHANERMAEMFGWPLDLLVGTEYVEHVHPSEREIGRQLTQRLLAAPANMTVDVERLYWRRDGSQFWGQLTGRQLRTNQGEMIGLLGVIADITRRKAAEEQLQLSARVFDVAQEGIMITDADNRIVSVNPAFTTITGYAPEDAIGQRPTLLASGKQPPEFYRELWTALLQEGKWQGEIWNRHKLGHFYPEWLSITAVRNPGGEIGHYVGIFSDISERKAAEARISHLAQYDYLTDLPNRALLYDRLYQALANAERYQRQFAVMFIDLDNFKPVNDTYGHEVGDLLLKEVADRLRASIRAADTVARHGGDEFVVLVTESGRREEIIALGQKLLAAIGEPYLCGGHTLHITPSIGFALYPEDGRDITRLMANADAAMYRAKLSGRNRIDIPTAPTA